MSKWRLSESLTVPPDDRAESETLGSQDTVQPDTESDEWSDDEDLVIVVDMLRSILEELKVLISRLRAQL